MPDLKIKRAPQTDSETRAWETVYDDINDIINSVNQKSTVESRNGTSGGDGDIRLFKDVDKTKYFIEGKFGDGWAKRELLFSDPNIDTQDESINFSATEAYVKPDGSVPFTGVQTGVSPSNTNHLATKGYIDNLVAGNDTLSELGDTTISSVANGNMLKYDTGTNTWINFVANFITSYTVSDSYVGSNLSPTVFGLKQSGTSSTTNIRGIRSANSNMTITLEESLENGAYLKFNVASPTGITSITGYDVGSGGYASAITGNTSLKFNDDYDSGTSTGIFFVATDSGNDTIITPSIVGALTDTNYYADSLAFNTSNGILTVGRAILADLTVDLDGRYSTTDYNTIYTTSWVNSGDNAILRLTAGGSGTGDDDLTLVAGSNIYLTPSGDNLTIAANNTTNYALTNSTSSGQNATLVTVNTGTAGKLRGFKQGSNITITSTDDGTEGNGYITIAANLSAATISTSYVNPLGGYLTQTTGNLRFIDGGGIVWALAAQGSGVTTVTPSFSTTYDNYSYWTAKDDDGTTYNITAGDTFQIAEGTGINANFTADDVLTITNTAPDVNHNTDVNWNCSTISGLASTGRSTLELGTAAQSATGDFAAASHNHSAGNITSGTLAVAQGGTGVTTVAEIKTTLGLGSAAYVDLSSQDVTDIGNLSGTNTGDQTIPTRDSLGIDTDDNVAFAQITCEDGMFVLDTTDESGTNAGFKKNGTDRIDIGWGGSYGANMELYSKSHSSRAGEFKLIYGTGGAAGSVYYTHKGGSHVDMAKLTHDGDWHVDKDVYAYSSSVGSDRKLKENIVDTKYGLKDVLKLRGVDFDWKEKRNKAHDVGVIAQEVREVIPEVVMEVENLNDKDTHLTVDYAKLVPVLIEAIKELSERKCYCGV